MDQVEEDKVAVVHSVGMVTVVHSEVTEEVPIASHMEVVEEDHHMV